MSIDTPICSQQLVINAMNDKEEVMDDIYEPPKRKFDSSNPYDERFTNLLNKDLEEKQQKEKEKGKKGSEREEEIGKDVAGREKTKRKNNGRESKEKEEQQVLVSIFVVVELDASTDVDVGETQKESVVFIVFV